MDLDSFFADTVLRAAVGRAIPDGSVVHFDIQGEGGGAWTLKRDRTRIDLLPAFEDRPDCRLRCTVSDFRALLDGDLDPRQGFLTGRLEVTGDVGIVLELRRALRTAT